MQHAKYYTNTLVYSVITERKYSYHNNPRWQAIYHRIEKSSLNRIIQEKIKLRIIKPINMS